MRPLKLIRTIIFSFLLSIINYSCKKYVEVDPPITQITSDIIYADDNAATSAISGIYSTMSAGALIGSVAKDMGILSDELLNYSNNGNQKQFYANSLTPNNEIVKAYWNDTYKLVYYANSVLEGLAKPNGVTDITKKQLEGEAKFIRGFCHFYLVNLFGDVPLITTTDYRVNSVVSRQQASDVYQQIISDLLSAKSLLSSEYVTGERIRPNKAAATALLARAYLYKGDWVNAEEQASEVISNSTSYSLETDLNNIFLGNSNETIWQVKPVFPEFNSFDGNIFILTTTPSNVALNDQLFGIFEPGDRRLTNWVSNITVGSGTYYFPYKYKVKNSFTVTEYNMILRLAEQYLIRAGARAKQNNITGAIADLNAIRTRAGLGNLSNGLTEAEVLLAVEQERRIELFAEMGHRWFDLKRTNRAEMILGPIKAPNWQPTDMLFPIPQSEIDRNPNLKQNQGY